MRKKLIKVSLLSAFVVIVFIVLTILFSSIVLLAHSTISFFIVPAAFCVTAVILYFTVRKLMPEKPVRNWLMVFSGFCLITIASLSIASTVNDTSWDGQEYHLAAMIKLTEGWNPCYEHVPETISSDNAIATWINHYPKGLWMYGAALAAITGNVESGKSINILLMAAAFFLTVVVLLCFETVPLMMAIIIGVLTACNPVSLYQSFSNYVDGALSSVLICLVALGILIIFRKKDTLALVLFSSLIALAFSIKFTGPILAVIIAGLFIVGLLITQKNIRAIIMPSIVILGGVCVGAGIIGYSPYVKNAIDHGHCMYPVLGKDKIDIITEQLPINFKTMNRFERLFYSLFSKTDNSCIFPTEEFTPSELKIPCTVYRSEFRNIDVDTRIAGYGVLFSGILFIAFLLFIVQTVLFYRAGSKKSATITLAISSAVLFTVLIIPQCWWARYVPQLWLLPMIVLVASFHCITLVKGFVKYVLHTLNSVLLLLITANLLIIVYCFGGFTLGASASLDRELQAMKDVAPACKLRSGLFETITKYRLAKAHVRYTLFEKYDFTSPVKTTFLSGSIGYNRFYTPARLPLELERPLLSEKKLTFTDTCSDTTLKPFIGVWEGRTSGLVGCAFAVTGIHGNYADIVAAGDNYFPFYIYQYQTKTKAMIVPGSSPSLSFTLDQTTISLTLGTSGLTCMEVLSTPYFNVCAYLRKKPGIGFNIRSFVYSEDKLPDPITTLGLHQSKSINRDSVSGNVSKFLGRWESLYPDTNRQVFVFSRVHDSLITTFMFSQETADSSINPVDFLIPKNCDDKVLLYNSEEQLLQVIMGEDGITLEVLMDTAEDTQTYCFVKTKTAKLL